MKSKALQFLFALGVADQFLMGLVIAFTWSIEPGNRADILSALLLMPFWGFLHFYFGLYESHRLGALRSTAAMICTASTLGFCTVAALLWFSGTGRLLPSLFDFTLIWIAAAVAVRWVVYGVLHLLRKRGIDSHYVCVIGTWEKAAEIARGFAENPEWGLRVGIVGVGPHSARRYFSFPDKTPFGADLETVLTQSVVDEILIAARPEDVAAEEPAVKLARQLGLLCRVRLEKGEEDDPELQEFDEPMTWTSDQNGRKWGALGVKRAADIAVSLTLLILLSPLFLLVGLLVRLSSPGPVFFTQARVGLRGRHFRVVKFRTMIAGAESMRQSIEQRNITGGPGFKAYEDWRVTKIGKILRRFSLDELPQLFNVLKGDMSLVGPRPYPIQEASGIKGPYRRRFSMRPGITCSWQVMGRSDIEFHSWMELDLQYVDNWSLKEDVRLLLLTIPAVFTGRGAY